MLAWLDDRIKIAKGTSSIPTWSAGDYKASAQTADHSDGAGGMWLICDGTAIPSQWATLVGLVGANRPDARGRTIVMKGTHTDVNALLDSEGSAVANRTPIHNSTNSLNITGAPGIGTLAVSPSSHTHSAGSGSDFVVNNSQKADIPAGTGIFVGGGGSSITGSQALSISGAPAVGSLAVGGTIGVGGTRPNDTPAYLVIGNLFIHT